MEKSCNEPESEIKVSDDSGSYFSDESDTKTDDSIAPDDMKIKIIQRVYRTVTCWLTLKLEMIQLVNLSRKYRRKM